MFENQKNVIEALLQSDESFRRLYDQHQQLDKRVTAAETGSEPMDDLALNALKKEKLMTKDNLARMMQGHKTQAMAS